MMFFRKECNRAQREKRERLQVAAGARVGFTLEMAPVKSEKEGLQTEIGGARYSDCF